MRKKRFLAFMFALIPGCGHMYLGYMRRGVEFMIMFAASVYLSFTFVTNIRMDMIGAIFMILLPVIWLYQMFDSMNTLSRMRILEMQYAEDDGFFIPGISNITNLAVLNVFKKRGVIKAIAIIFICLGAYILFINISDGIYRVLLASARLNYYLREKYSEIYRAIYRYLPPVMISLALLFGGIKLLRGNKKNKNDNISDYINTDYVNEELK